MKHGVLSTLAMGLGAASAAVLHPRASSGTCCFGINVNGGAQSGSLGQLSDGQNRVGPGFGGSSFCITGTTITDSSGRGCVVALPQTQFQCDSGAAPTPGFSVTSGGLIEYNGSTVFYECAVNDDSQYNIYTTPGGTKCSQVTLSTTNSNCAAPAPYPNTTTSYVPSAYPTASGVSYTTLVSTVPASTVTVVSSASASTVTLPATTVYETAGASTTTLPATTVYETAGASTITLPASTVYETAPASSCATVSETVTAYSTVTAAGAETTVTAYSTVTAAGAETTVTEYSTVTAAGAETTVTAYSTVTASAATEYVTVTAYATETAYATATAYATVTGAGSTVLETVSSVETETASITEVSTAYATATVTGAGQTVVESETASVTVATTAYETVTGAGTTVIESETASVTVATTAYETVTGAGTTVVESETASVTVPTTTYETVVESTTATEVTTASATASPTTATVVYSTTATATPTSYSTTASASPTSTSCPADLSGNYQYPHLIIPVNSSAPTTAFGTQYFGQVSSTVSSLFNFDIPASYQGSTCSLIFLLPLPSQLETSSYTTSGSGGIEILELSSAATSATTYDTVPSVESDLGTFDVTPGSSTVIATTACAAGETLSYEVKATGSYALYWFEDYNPSPLGLYIREC